MLDDEDLIVYARDLATALPGRDPELTDPGLADIVDSSRAPGGRGLAGAHVRADRIVVTRIVSGSRGGRRLAMPPGDQTRPTTERVREALFSALASWTGGSSGPPTSP